MTSPSHSLVRSLLASGLLAVLAVVAGCSDGSTEPGGPAVDVVSQIGGKLADAGVHADPGSLTCAGALAPQVGQTVRCSLTAEGQPVDLVARAAAVDGTRVDVELTTEARPVAKALLQEAVAERIGLDLTASLTSTTCDGDLQPEVGSATTCTLTSGSETRAVRVTVTSVDGGRMEYRIENA